MDTFCPNPKSIYKNFEKKLQKSCKKVAKILQKNLQNFCRFFAEFLQLHILQKVLHFRPREESVTLLWTEKFRRKQSRKIQNSKCHFESSNSGYFLVYKIRVQCEKKKNFLTFFALFYTCTTLVLLPFKKKCSYV